MNPLIEGQNGTVRSVSKTRAARARRGEAERWVVAVAVVLVGQPHLGGDAEQAARPYLVSCCERGAVCLGKYRDLLRCGCEYMARRSGGCPD